MNKKFFLLCVLFIFSSLLNILTAQYAIILKIKPTYKSFCTTNEIKIAAYQTFFSSKNSTPKQLFPHAFIPDKKNVLAFHAVDISTIYEFIESDSIQAQKSITYLSSLPQTEYCHRKHYPQLLYTPNDPYIGNQYQLFNIKAYEAWNIYKGDNTIVIGIIDTGTELAHDDLWQNIAYNYADPIDGIDNDGDGYVDNFKGWDLGNNDNSPEWSENALDAEAHGVLVSGLAACTTNNNIGVASPAFASKFLPVKINDSTGILTRAYEGIVYVADHGCNIINCSWGGTVPDDFGKDIIKYATYNRGCLVVAAAGNEGNTLNRIYYPAAYDEVICVAATNSSDIKWVKSCYGPRINVCAPGENVFSTYENNGYTSGWGTSFASPLVASEASLVWGYRGKQLNPFQIKSIIENTCDNIDTVSGNENFAHQLGKGRINCYRALTDTIIKSVRFYDYTFSTHNDTTYLSGNFINLFHATTHLVARLTSDNPNIVIENPVLTIGEMDSLQTFNHTTTPFKIYYLPSSPYDINVSFYLEFIDTNYFDKQYLNATIHLSYADLYNSDLLLTVCANGKLGYNSFNPSEGKGLLFKSDISLLSEMGLMVSDGNNYSFSFRGGNAFNIKKGTLKTEDGVHAETNSCFNDSLSINPIGLDIHLNAMLSKLPALRDFFILNYTITNNKSSTIDSLFVGLFSDMDLLNPFRNKTNYDSLMKLLYVYPANMDDVHIGLMLPDSYPHKMYAIDNNGQNGSIDINTGFSPQAFNTALTTNRYNAGGLYGNDVSILTSYGPVSLLPHDSISLHFIIPVGRNKYEMMQSAINALTYYDSIIGIMPVSFSPDILIFPNPADGYFFIQCNDNTIQSFQMDIYDLLGNNVFSGSYINQQNNSISLHLPRGLYIVHIRTNEQKNYFRKLIIMPTR